MPFARRLHYWLAAFELSGEPRPSGPGVSPHQAGGRVAELSQRLSDFYLITSESDAELQTQDQ